MNVLAIALLGAAMLTTSMADAMTGGSVAPPFRGTWVPGSAACTSPLKVVIDSNAVSFVNGAQRADYRKLEQCFTCMGRDVQNITLLSTDAMGDSPWQLYLDSSRKTPSVTAEFGNDKKLGARFPLGQGKLKKCP